MGTPHSHIPAAIGPCAEISDIISGTVVPFRIAFQDLTPKSRPVYALPLSPSVRFRHIVPRVPGKEKRKKRKKKNNNNKNNNKVYEYKHR